MQPVDVLIEAAYKLAATTTLFELVYEDLRLGRFQPEDRLVLLQDNAPVKNTTDPIRVFFHRATLHPKGWRPEDIQLGIPRYAVRLRLGRLLTIDPVLGLLVGKTDALKAAIEHESSRSDIADAADPPDLLGDDSGLSPGDFVQL